MTPSVSFKLLPIAAVLLTLGACSSGSSKPVPTYSQAIDGYIVGASVSCDGLPSGLTQAAGAFTCPADTLLSKISGGYDVGIDDEATSGTVAFTGVLTAPASAPYVTPMTTLTVALAQTPDGEFDPDAFAAAQDTLARTLGIDDPTLLLANPVENLEAAKNNAKLHQVLAAFAPGTEDYEQATAMFAAVVEDVAETTGGSISLTQDVQATMLAINEKLSAANSPLMLATIDLDQAASNVMLANATIDSADSAGKVNVESQKALISQAPLTINRDEASVVLTSGTDGKLTSTTLSLDGFENALLTDDGYYTATLYSDFNQVGYTNDVFQFNQNINETQITVAFELTSVREGDSRSVSIVSDEVVVSAIKGQPESLRVYMLSDDSTFDVIGTGSSGVITEAVIKNNGGMLSSDGDAFTFDLYDLNQQLADLGFDDMLNNRADYAVTLVVSGLRINERVGNDVSEGQVLSVETSNGIVKGNGIKGYVSIVR